MKNDVPKSIRFDNSGLVPVVVQQYDTREVLMFAWMNSESVEQTFNTGRLHYFSRSRRKLWKKGEISGQEQDLVELRLDCDGDAVLALVNQTGVACHTGRRTCFFTNLSKAGVKEIRQKIKNPERLYG